MGLLEDLLAWWNERRRRNARMVNIQRRLNSIDCSYARAVERGFDSLTGDYTDTKTCSVCSSELYLVSQEASVVVSTPTKDVQLAKSDVCWKNLESSDRWKGSWCFVCDAHLEDRIIEEEVKMLPAAVLQSQIVATRKLQAEVLAAHAAKMQRLDAEVAAKTARLRELEGSSQFPQGGYRGVPVSTVNAS